MFESPKSFEALPFFLSRHDGSSKNARMMQVGAEQEALLENLQRRRGERGPPGLLVKKGVRTENE